MLSKCLNPACSVPFLYLQQGRLFRVDLTSSGSSRKGQRMQKPAYFWLCRDCCLRLEIAVENGQVMTRSLPAKKSAERAPSERPKKDAGAVA